MKEDQNMMATVPILINHGYVVSTEVSAMKEECMPIKEIRVEGETSKLRGLPFLRSV